MDGRPAAAARADRRRIDKSPGRIGRSIDPVGSGAGQRHRLAELGERARRRQARTPDCGRLVRFPRPSPSSRRSRSRRPDAGALPRARSSDRSAVDQPRRDSPTTGSSSTTTWYRLDRASAAAPRIALKRPPMTAATDRANRGSPGLGVSGRSPCAPGVEMRDDCGRILVDAAERVDHAARVGKRGLVRDRGPRSDEAQIVANDVGHHERSAFRGRRGREPSAFDRG